MIEGNNNTIKKLENLFFAHKSERICVVGTTCCGKTTLLKKLPYCSDMDSEIFPLLSEDEKAYVCKTPWSSEIGEEMDRLVKERLKIKPGFPMFGTVIIDCDVVVYLDISLQLLSQRCRKRGVQFHDALMMKNSIENDLKIYHGKVIIVTIN